MLPVAACNTSRGMPCFMPHLVARSAVSLPSIRRTPGCCYCRHVDEVSGGSLRPTTWFRFWLPGSQKMVSSSDAITPQATRGNSTGFRCPRSKGWVLGFLGTREKKRIFLGISRTPQTQQVAASLFNAMQKATTPTLHMATVNF